MNESERDRVTILPIVVTSPVPSRQYTVFLGFISATTLYQHSVRHSPDTSTPHVLSIQVPPEFCPLSSDALSDGHHTLNYLLPVFAMPQQVRY